MSNDCLIAVCGPVDAGKSSLIGVLTSGELDDGKDSARNKILVHPHEQISGRTSNITFNPLIYNKYNDGIYLMSCQDKKNNKFIKQNKIKELDNEPYQRKTISFIDLAGHEKYLKTTVYGVTGTFPDYGIVVIGANTGLTKLTREHIGILFYLKIPFIICITKVDIAPRHIYQKLCNRIKNLLKKNTFGKILYFISDSEKNDEETKHYIDKMIGNPEIIPIISLSNKNGKNINNVHKILASIPPREKWLNQDNDHSIVYIDNNYHVPGIGLVLSGTLKGKGVKVKDKMYLGPINGNFYPVMIRSMHNSTRESIEESKNNRIATYNIKFTNSKKVLSRSQLKKGMVLIDDENYWRKNIAKSFEARVTILQHSTTIKSGYSPVIHCGPIRQSARIILQDQPVRSGDSKIVKVEFVGHPEFLEKNMIFFFRDGTTKGVGEVLYIN
jgi:GTPase